MALTRAKATIPTAFEGDTIGWMREFLNLDLPYDVREQIYKDLTRTMPADPFFSEKEGFGSKALFGVLKCLTFANPEVGYVQGMSFIAAVFIAYTCPNDSFLLLNAMIRNLGLNNLYKEGFPGLKEIFFVH